MSKIYTSADQLVGNTPLLELTHLEKKYGLKATLLGKLEYFNPAGSVKDRIAKAMIKETSIASLLPIIELMKLGNQIYAKTYHPFEIFITIAVVYFLMTYFVTLLSRWIERRLAVWAN